MTEDFPKNCSVWRNNENSELYQVLHAARHSETDDPLVVYRELNEAGKVRCRPLSMWHESCTVFAMSFTEGDF
jgi:hypothetical protein